MASASANNRTPRQLRCIAIPPGVRSAKTARSVLDVTRFVKSGKLFRLALIFKRIERSAVKLPDLGLLVR
jgi:hypothetical protein